MKKAIIFFLLTFLSCSTFAVDGIFLNYGKGMSDLLIQSRSISGATQKSLGLTWNTPYDFEIPLFGHAELEIETYYSSIKRNETVNIIAIRPVLNFWSDQQKQNSFYWQFGVGVSYFDNKQLTPVTLSSYGQFATMFGIGMPLDSKQKHRLTLRYNHYSNAYIKKPNYGIDTLSVDWSYRF